MQIVNQAKLSPEAHAELERRLPQFGTLMEFVAWGRRQTPPVLLRETVALDEYTHEVLSEWAEYGGLFFALGAT